MIIKLSGQAPPTEQIRNQIQGLIISGQLAQGQRLPSIRQLAKDLNVATGTVAKAYKALEAMGLLVTRTAQGTRVSDAASTTSLQVLKSAYELVDISLKESTSLEETIQVLRAIWPHA